MKTRRFTSIQVKMLLTIAPLLIAIVATIAIVIGLQSRTMLRKDGEQIAAEAAGHYANIAKAVLEVPLDEARSLATVFGAAANVDGVSLTRRKANLMLKYFIEQRTEFLGVYVAFEPDGYDGHDANFIDEHGHDATGRFVPYWTRDAEGTGVLEALVSYDTVGDGDYYQIPKATNRESVLDPYLYEIQGVDVMLTSLVVPIQDASGRFLGIAGLDLTLDQLQQTVVSMTLDGFPHAYVTFYSTNGSVVASKDAADVGNTVTALYGAADPLTTGVLGDRDFLVERHSGFLDEEVLTYGTKVEIGNTGNFWTVAVNIPTAELYAAAARLNTLIIAIGAAAAIIGSFLVFLLIRSIAKPIRFLADGAQRLSTGDSKLEGMDRASIERINQRNDELGETGRAFSELIEYFDTKADIAGAIAAKDLTKEVPISSEEDQLGHALAQMSHSLSDFMRTIQTSVDQVSSGAAQVAQSSQSLSQGATEQASSLEEVSSSMTEIASQSQQNADHAKEANALAKEAVAGANAGNEQMGELVDAMEEINNSSGEIEKVVKVIDDIAFQINLLALNANVEAARAGKYGKGFAVVAEEVRNLAVRSAQAVQETTGMVQSSVKSIAKGNEAARTTADQLSGIVEGISKIATLLDEISSASGEQAEGIEQVNGGLDQIDQVTQANTASAEESASASEELASQASHIRQIAAEFRVNSTEASAGPPALDGVTAEPISRN